MIKVGDKVKILRQDVFHLQYRYNRRGIVTNVDGAYITVRHRIGFLGQLNCILTKLR